jgi:hypothetical protein
MARERQQHIIWVGGLRDIEGVLHMRLTLT